MQPTNLLPLPEFEFGDQRAFKQVIHPNIEFKWQSLNIRLFTQHRDPRMIRIDLVNVHQN